MGQVGGEEETNGGREMDIETRTQADREKQEGSKTRHIDTQQTNVGNRDETGQAIPSPAPQRAHRPHLLASAGWTGLGPVQAVRAAALEAAVNVQATRQGRALADGRRPTGRFRWSEGEASPPLVRARALGGWFGHSGCGNLRSWGTPNPAYSTPSPHPASSTVRHRRWCPQVPVSCASQSPSLSKRPR